MRSAKPRRRLGRSSKAVRAHKPSGVDAFLHAYDLGSDEGIAMMCLAEALLRIPDAHTADELIADKLAGTRLVREARPLGSRPSSTRRPSRCFSPARCWKERRIGPTIGRRRWAAPSVASASRSSAPAVREAMRILGGNFVFGRTIDEALKRAAPERRKRAEPQLRHAGRGGEDLCRRRTLRQELSQRRLDRLAKEAKGGFRSSPGISVKLTALHPRYEYYHAEAAVARTSFPSCASWR